MDHVFEVNPCPIGFVGQYWPIDHKFWTKMFDFPGLQIPEVKHIQKTESQDMAVRAWLRTSQDSSNLESRPVGSQKEAPRCLGWSDHLPERSSTNLRGVMGTFSEGLSTKVFPHAIAKGNIHRGTMAGKLKGVIPATTPSGNRRV